MNWLSIETVQEGVCLRQLLHHERFDAADSLHWVAVPGENCVLVVHGVDLVSLLVQDLVVSFAELLPRLDRHVHPLCRGFVRHTDPTRRLKHSEMKGQIRGILNYDRLTFRGTLHHRYDQGLHHDRELGHRYQAPETLEWHAGGGGAGSST